MDLLRFCTEQNKFTGEADEIVSLINKGTEL